MMTGGVVTADIADFTGGELFFQAGLGLLYDLGRGDVLPMAGQDELYGFVGIFHEFGLLFGGNVRCITEQLKSAPLTV